MSREELDRQRETFEQRIDHLESQNEIIRSQAETNINSKLMDQLQKESILNGQVL